MGYGDFKDKKITLVGLGQYKFGSGISAAKFLLKNGARLVVTDLKSQKDLATSHRALDTYWLSLKRRGSKPHPIQYVWGKHRRRDFIQADLVFRNPAVPNNSPYLALARKHGVPIETDDSLFLQLCPGRVIGITGTRGKSTTTAIIYEMLKEANKAGRHRVFLGGNILFSPLNFLEKIKPGDWVVLELSSYQTENFVPFKVSPHISLITNLYPDHLIAYKDFQEYASAKEPIFTFQKPSDFSVVNYDNPDTRKMGGRVPSARFWFAAADKFKPANGAYLKNDWVCIRRDGREDKVVDLKKIKLIGDHNRLNVAAAALAASLAGASARAMAAAAARFPGLPSRLEFIREARGVRYYNDSTATTAEGTIAALNSFPSNNVILIAGGSEKNLPFDGLAKSIIAMVSQLVLLKDKASVRIEREVLKRKKSFPIVWAQDMGAAVRLATEAAAKSGRNPVVLMSPACASFGLFKNEFDRAEKFKAAVKRLR